MGRPLKILIADDEDDHITILGLYLKNIGADVESARDPEDCLRMFEFHRPELVFLDVDLGFPGGFVTAGKIRAKAAEFGQPVRIFMYTARKTAGTCSTPKSENFSRGSFEARPCRALFRSSIWPGRKYLSVGGAGSSDDPKTTP